MSCLIVKSVVQVFMIIDALLKLVFAIVCLSHHV